MVRLRFLILLMLGLSMGQERLDSTLIELPLDNDVGSDGTFWRYQRHLANPTKSTTELPLPDVVAVPLRPNLAALPPHMNIKPPDNHDVNVYVCEAILPSLWNQLPTKLQKASTKTPSKDKILSATMPAHSTPSPIEKTTPLQPIEPKIRPSPNKDSLAFKVSSFNIEGNNKTNNKEDRKNSNFVGTKQDGNKTLGASTAHSVKNSNNKINKIEKVEVNRSNGKTNMTTSSPLKIFQNETKKKNNTQTSHKIPMPSTSTPLQKYKESENMSPIKNSNSTSVKEKGKGALGTLVDTDKNVAVEDGEAVLIAGAVAIGTAGKAAGLAGGGSTMGGGGDTSSPSNLDLSHQNNPTISNNNNADKRSKQKQANQKKEEDFENDFGFDLDFLNEDEFINYDKYKIKLHSIDNITVMFADKFKRLEYVCEWFANNFTNELNNLTEFRHKHFDMARKVQEIRERLGDKMDLENDDVYNQMVEGYNAGTLFEKELQHFDEEIEYIHSVVSEFSDAASIVEDESFRMKTYLVTLLLRAKDFLHPLYRVVGAVRVLTSVAKLRTTDCLSPYILVYQTWRGTVKKLYREGIQLERDTYKSLSRESYSNMDEWRNVKRKFLEFTKRAKNKLQDARESVESLREPIYTCVVDVAKYMFYKFAKILPEIRKNIKI